MKSWAKPTASSQQRSNSLKGISDDPAGKQFDNLTLVRRRSSFFEKVDDQEKPESTSVTDYLPAQATNNFYKNETSMRSDKGIPKIVIDTA